MALPSWKKNDFVQGFSLVELLVGVAILGLLAGVSGAVYQKAIGKASLVAEVSAGKNLIQAYLLAASENGGRYLPAHDKAVGSQTVLDNNGKPITMKEIKYRYPFRLAPFFNNQIEGTILVNRNESQIIREMGSPGTFYYTYGLSQFPALGINRYMVGGNVTDTNGTVQYANECIMTTAQAEKSVVVFVSAGTSQIDGYEYVTPPKGPPGNWSSAEWQKNSDPSNYGYVSARFEGKAVVAFLDGAVKTMSIDELRDMRLWSKNAALANDPNYRPQ